MRLLKRIAFLGLPAVLAMNASGLPANPVPGESDLVGLWRAKQRFGPELRGALTIERREEGWSAEIAGRTAPVRMEGDRLSFELPGGEGSFRGRLAPRCFDPGPAH